MALIRAIGKLALALTLGVSTAAAQEILGDAADTAMRSASGLFYGHAAGPYSPSEIARNAPGTGLNEGDLPKIRRYAERSATGARSSTTLSGENRFRRLGVGHSVAAGAARARALDAGVGG